MLEIAMDANLNLHSLLNDRHKIARSVKSTTLAVCHRPHDPKHTNVVATEKKFMSECSAAYEAKAGRGKGGSPILQTSLRASWSQNGELWSIMGAREPQN